MSEPLVPRLIAEAVLCFLEAKLLEERLGDRVGEVLQGPLISV
jgi:hypothetical protein